MSEGRTIRVDGAGGVMLAADEWGDPSQRTVLLLHGGGQTRHSWKSAGTVLADAGLHVVAMDLRGHGDSDWAPDGDYRITSLRDDILAALPRVGPPVTLVGASLGGITSLLVIAAAPALVDRLVLVDIVTRLEPAGTDRILGFLRATPDGFASLDEAADAVAAYLPHRERPRTADGLRKNLRLRGGRWYWHWDPAVFGDEGPRPGDDLEALDAAARSVRVPTLLLRGGRSDIVSDEGVEHFRTLIPHVAVVRLDEAAHTAAADDNDAFTSAVADFVLGP